VSPFDEARSLFNAYQKNGDLGNLRDSLDLLDELILNINEDSQRAINFKKTILKALENQIREIKTERNIPEFAKDIGPSDAPDFLDRVANVFAACFSTKDDFERFAELISIRRTYF